MIIFKKVILNNLINKIKKLLKYSVPPIFSIIYYKFKNISHNTLFDGDDEMFKRIIKTTKLYGEYGCGKSTNWVIKNSKIDILSVDTSALWVQKTVDINHQNKNRLKIKHIDFGEVGESGYPINYNKIENINYYGEWIWKHYKKPDMVLIDGRFRVFCFLTSLKYAEEGTNIIFDDYIFRHNYHYVEKYLKRTEVLGRQCLFIVPSKDKIDMKSLEQDINHFKFVMN
mgnify:FL=1